MTKVDISHKTIFFIAGFLGLIWLLLQIKEVILLLFVAIIFMSALAPLVDRLENLRFPRGLAIGLTYLLVVAILILLITSVVTPLVEQIPTMAATLPHTLDQLLPPGIVDKTVLQQELTSFSRNAVGLTLVVFSNFIAMISVAVLTFYLLLDRERFESLLSELFTSKKDRAKRLIKRLEYKLGAWVRGQLLLSVIIGALAYGLLMIMRVPYALPLAILAGLLEVVPVIGPIASGIPAVLMAYLVSPTTALLVGLGYLAIQQSESHFIVPQLMKKVVGLNPLVIILAIAAGGKLLGLAGALLAVPITVVIQLVTEEILQKDSS